MGDPAVRVKAARDVILKADRWQEGLTSALLMRLSPECAEVIQHGSSLSWLPVALDREVVGAVVDTLGESRAMAYWRETTAAHLESPLLRPLRDGAVRLMGLTPGTFVWLVPRGWRQIYRDFGTPVIRERDDRHAVLELVDIDPHVAAVPQYRVCFRAIFSAFFDLARYEGDVVEESADPSRLRYEWHW